MDPVSSQFTIALIQHTISTDKEKNLKRVEEFTESAVKLYQPHIIVLPEFFSCPLGIGKAPEYVEDEENSLTKNFLSNLAKKHNVYIIGGSFPTRKDGKIFNTNFNFNKNGELVSTFKKLHMFDINVPGKMVYQESKTITPGNEFGIFDTEYGRFGIGICYDIRFTEYSLILKKQYNVDMLVFPAAFNTTTGPLHWELLARSRAMDNQVYVAMCSPARKFEEGGYPIWGHSMIVDPFGQIVTSTGYQEDIVVSRIDLKNNQLIKEQIPIWSQKRYGELYDLTKL